MRRLHLTPGLLAVPITLAALAGTAAALPADPPPLQDALKNATPEARRFHQHVMLLAHPALEGRLPGQPGSRLAEEVIATTFAQLGLAPAFAEGSSHYQPFEFRQGGRFGDRAAASIVEGRNVGAVLPGRGSLADEWVVIGAHHDHLGRGDFGSRRGRGEIHEGADDNASGTAAVLLAAELLSGSLSNTDETAPPRRSILFVTFSGEESGLNGAAHLAEECPVPLGRIALMINIDMIGRITERALSVNGTGTGTGLVDAVERAAVGSGLEVRTPTGLTSRSDHAEFYRREVPVLFVSESVFPDEYHTPDDDAWRINTRDGAAAAGIVARIASDIAHRPDPPDHIEIEGFEGGGDGPALGDIKVRFGIKPGNYGDTDPGIAIAGVSPDTSAESAGLLKGDRLLRWNGSPIEGIREWMLMMAGHEPGDVVTVTVLREGEEIDLPVMLKPRDG